MKSILKLFRDWGAGSQKTEFEKATLRLTVRYSVLIFVLLFVVSVLVYVVFMLGLGITIGDGPLIGVLEENSYYHEASERLFDAILIVNLVAWFFVSIFSYFLARGTLRPVEKVYGIQEKFVADVAHELRTPLAVMKSGSEIMLKTDRENNEYKGFIEESLEEVNRLIILSNELLLLLQHKLLGSRTTESVHFSVVVKERVTQMKVYAELKNVMIKMDIVDDIYVRGNRMDIERLVGNFVKNAIDYNKLDGSVEVSLKQEGSNAILRITDTGIGMNEKDTTHIFDRFYKADTAREQKSETGTGLGLSIAKEIVDAHEGTITVASTEGEGSTFTISIPCA